MPKRRSNMNENVQEHHLSLPKRILRSSKLHNNKEESKMKKILKETQVVETIIDISEEKEEPQPVMSSPNGLSAAETLRMAVLAKTFTGTTPADFLEHVRTFMTAANITNAEVLTVEQADTALWHQLRIGRITASRVHQASRCKTKGGSLYNSIMGRSRGWSFAMQRGTNLEEKVFKIVARDMAIKGIKVRQVGLILDASLPHFGASPDGLADDFTLEIKCPFTAKTHDEYTDVSKLKRQYWAQIQLQMHISKRKKAILAVADIHFERNNHITLINIDYDEQYTKELIEDADNFWNEEIFPGLLKEYRRIR